MVHQTNTLGPKLWNLIYIRSVNLLRNIRENWYQQLEIREWSIIYNRLTSFDDELLDLLDKIFVLNPDSRYDMN